MLWVVQMTKKKRTIDKASIGVLKTHVEYIREAIDRIEEEVLNHVKLRDKQLEQVSQNFKNMDDRIQKLEDWVSNIEKSEEKGSKSKSFKLACIGLAVSTIINIISIILNMLGYI